MKKICSLLLFLMVSLLNAQNYSFKTAEFLWPNNKPSADKLTNEFINEDIVVIDEDVKINAVNTAVETINKNCILKINTEKGGKKLKSISLPESFDPGADKYLEQQGRQTNTQAPFIYKFKIAHFAARVLKMTGKVIDLPMNVRYNKIFWVDNHGFRMEDFNYVFSFDNLEVGDIVEYNYEIQFVGRYGGNLFYFNGEYPKQNSLFEIKYAPIPNLGIQQYVYNGNGADSFLIKSVNDEKVKTRCSYSYKLSNLKSINYPVNTCSGKNLPYVFIDLNFLTFLGYSNIPTEALVFKKRGPNFEWLALKNKYDEKSIYDKQHANIRKFLSVMSYDENNTDKPAFIVRLNDTLNTFNFASSESMHYNENAQYAVGSGEWLLKGKLVEEFMFDLYWQILNETKIPKNLICMQDKRLGEHRTDYRTAYEYEHNIIGINNGKSMVYMIPRFNGRKYNLDEVPFYFEGVTAAVMDYDIEQANLHNIYQYSSFINPKVINFIKTPSSTENENVRTENGMFKINLDSNLINVSLKENLNGQFSTIIRPIYLNDPIDSTVNPVYFKKCTDKPNALNIAIKKSSGSTTFPFKNSFVCTEKIKFSNTDALPLKNWFSFTFNKQFIKEKPNFDYYFDFRYTDIYNYMIEFNKPVQVTNLEEFSKSIQNNSFELSSKLIKQSETSYLLSVMVKIKEPILKQSDGQLLLDFVNELDALNEMSLKLK